MTDIIKFESFQSFLAKKLEWDIKLNQLLKDMEDDLGTPIDRVVYQVETSTGKKTFKTNIVI